MKEIYCNNQVELDKALSERQNDHIIICRGSEQFEVRGSSQVTAYDSSQVRAYGSSQVTASKYVAVTIPANSKSKVKGGVKIKIPAIRTAVEWCKFYDVTVKAGVAIIYKALRSDYKSSHGFLYAPNSIPSAPDWDGGVNECGGGLHFSPRPAMALAFDSQAIKFMACPVLVKEIKVHKNATYPEKVKAPRVFKPCYEVDINGNRLERTQT